MTKVTDRGIKKEPFTYLQYTGGATVVPLFTALAILGQNDDFCRVFVHFSILISDSYEKIMLTRI